MCGIVGYIGNKNATEVVLNGLQRVEYRGYDSAGLAFINNLATNSNPQAPNNNISRIKKSGRLSNLIAAVNLQQHSSHIAIAHTR